MQAHHYHPESGAYLGSEAARPDPLEHEAAIRSATATAIASARQSGKLFDPNSVSVEPQHFLVPAFATTAAPPNAGSGQRAHFVNGQWTLRQVVVPEAVISTPPDPWSLLRARRDELLRQSDWTQLADAAISEEVRESWAKYRSMLRAAPTSVDDPEKIVWPDPPKGA